MTEAPAPSPWTGRHPSVKHFEQVLTPNPHLTGVPANIATLFYGVAVALLNQVQDGPELSTALRKVWEAKNCAIMQAVLDRDATPAPSQFNVTQGP